jgi:hypothetical protein
MFLLKALQITSDPKKLKQMMGFKTIAEVYRTLDKMAMRREFHEALARNGISFDYIVGGIKEIADTGYKDMDRLKAFQTLLKSVGMEKYDDSSGASSGTWEEVLLKKIDEGKKENKDNAELEPGGLPMYEVKQPVMPASARLAQEEEQEMTSSIYDKKE